VKNKEKEKERGKKHLHPFTPLFHLKNQKKDLAASNLLARAVTTDVDAAADGLGLEDSLDVERDLDVEAGDGIDLSAVVGGGLVDADLGIDGVAPSSIDLLDGGASVHDELAVAVVAALAGPGELPLEIDGGEAVEVLEGPAEGSPLLVLEALEIHPGDTLRDSTSPVGLVVHNRGVCLDKLPHSLADGNDGGNVDVGLRASEVGGLKVSRGKVGRGSKVCTLELEVAGLVGKGQRSNNQNNKKRLHGKKGKKEKKKER